MTSAAEQLGSHVLAYGKRLAPDRFPKLDPETCRAWGATLASVPLPANIWPEAVQLWALELAGDRMATPRELKQAALVVRDRWESDPERRVALERHRREQREERDRQLAAGTFGQLRGYTSRALGRPKPREGGYGHEVLAGLLRRVGRPVGELDGPQDRREAV